MKYKIVEMESSAYLEELVNQWVFHGWEPIGGVSVCAYRIYDRRDDTGAYDTHFVYAQAMVKRDE